MKKLIILSTGGYYIGEFKFQVQQVIFSTICIIDPVNFILQLENEK